MTKSKKCGGKVDLADERTLTCTLPTGHDGPVHEDADGEQWGDFDLSPQPVEQNPTLPNK